LAATGTTVGWWGWLGVLPPAADRRLVPALFFNGWNTAAQRATPDSGLTHIERTGLLSVN
jgi:hypothetical protein